jgi:hypothetical protein
MYRCVNVLPGIVGKLFISISVDHSNFLFSCRSSTSGSSKDGLSTEADSHDFAPLSGKELVHVCHWQPMSKNSRNKVSSVRCYESSNELKGSVIVFLANIVIDLHHKRVCCQPIESPQSQTGQRHGDCVFRR